MASKKKRDPAGAIQPGDELAEGIAVRMHDDGWLVGRAAEPHELKSPTPDGHSEHFFGDRRVFLSHNQGPIPADRLHRAG
jgi:hypothetical protein